MPRVSRCSPVFLTMGSFLWGPPKVFKFPQKCVIMVSDIRGRNAWKECNFSKLSWLWSSLISPHLKKKGKFLKSKAAEARFILFPSKQAEWAQTADNKIHSGNNYHPLRLDSHICMMLESIHKGKINLKKGRGEIKPPLFFCMRSRGADLHLSSLHQGEMQSSSTSL